MQFSTVNPINYPASAVVVTILSSVGKRVGEVMRTSSDTYSARRYNRKCLIIRDFNTYAEAVAFVLRCNPRAIRKTQRKIMQRPYRSAAAWRADAISEIEYMATLRQHIADEAHMSVSADVDLAASRAGHMANRRVSRNNARFMRKAAYREGFKLP